MESVYTLFILPQIAKNLNDDFYIFSRFLRRLVLANWSTTFEIMRQLDSSYFEDLFPLVVNTAVTVTLQTPYDRLQLILIYSRNLGCCMMITHRNPRLSVTANLLRSLGYRCEHRRVDDLSSIVLLVSASRANPS